MYLARACLGVSDRCPEVVGVPLAFARGIASPGCGFSFGEADAGRCLFLL